MTRLVLAVALVGTTLATARAEPARAPEVDVRLEGGATGFTVARAIDAQADGPVTTHTLDITITSTRAEVGEARLALSLPPDAVVGRLALDVAGRWMEGEVLPAGVATAFYDAIVRPAGARRDPALLVENTPGAWSLSVFPVPPAGARRVVVTFHRFGPATPGAVRVEALPPSLEDDGVAFVAVPRFDRAVDGPRPARVVVALDTSLSLGRAGLAEAIAVARRIAAAHPDVRLVSGDLTARPCAAPLEDCLARLEPGGATDLAALVAAAVAAAGPGPAAVVLVSDGRATAGATIDRLAVTIAEHAAAGPLVLHAVGVGRARDAALARLAAAGRGRAHGDILAALAAPRRPSFEVHGAREVELVERPDGLLMIGRADRGARLDVARSDDLGASRVSVALPSEVARGFGIARLLGALSFERAGPYAARVARGWGIARGPAAMLALEADADYGTRGIARYKEAERAAELGRPAPAITPGDRARDDQLLLDRDGDGAFDVIDQCPDAPETVNGFADQDGCPDSGRVLILAHELRILESVWFTSGSAAVREQALPLLHEVARVLAENPDLELVALEGHTDTREPGRQALSLRRAAAVRDVLVGLGVAPERLYAVGFAEHQPIAPNATADGRERNRRVGFRIVVRGGEVVSDMRPEDVASVARASGDGAWVYDAAIARTALARGDRAAATAAFERAWAAAADPARRLSIFDAALAAAWPARYREVVRAMALAGARPDARAAERFYAELAAQLAAPAPADAVGLRAAAEAWLTTLADPDARWGAPLGWLGVSADLLERLGRLEDAARRRSEQDERRAD